MEGLQSEQSPFVTSFASPNITSLSPARVQTSGGVQTIIGTNLGYVGMPAFLVAVRLTNLVNPLAPVTQNIPFATVVSDTQLTITAPAGEVREIF